MTSTDKEIELMAHLLKTAGYSWNDLSTAADMLLALKARVETLEKAFSGERKAANELLEKYKEMETRAEAAEKQRDEYFLQWQNLRLNGTAHWQQLAEAAEKRWTDYHTLASHSLAVMTARAEAAEKELRNERHLFVLDTARRELQARAAEKRITELMAKLGLLTGENIRLRTLLQRREAKP